MFYYFYQSPQMPFSYYCSNLISTFASVQQCTQSQNINSIDLSATQLKENYMSLCQKIILTKNDLEQAGYQITKKSWTEKEDQLLLFLRDKKKMDWLQIQKKLPERNKKMCYSRYRRLKNCNTKHWLEKDNQKLLRLVSELGENWFEIIKHFKNRNLRQIKQHYSNYLRPGIVECKWTVEDDLKLIQLLNKHGKNWKVIQDVFHERSLNQIKNRYYGRINKLNQSKLLKQLQNHITP